MRSSTRATGKGDPLTPAVPRRARGEAGQFSSASPTHNASRPDPQAQGPGHNSTKEPTYAAPPELLTKTDTVNAAKAKAGTRRARQAHQAAGQGPRRPRPRRVRAVLKSKAPAWQIEQLTGMPAERIHDLASLMRKAGDV